MAVPPGINTKVSPRRTLKFATIEDVEAELSRIEAAHLDGTVRTTGNWTPGQIFGHLATWLGFGYEGYPISPPWLVKLIVRRRKSRYLGDQMPAGVRIPGLEHGTLGTEPQEFAQGIRRLRAGLARLRAEPPPHSNPLFGDLTHQEWIDLHLRHAELHLGFITY